jgi:Tfp pilus assembly protein PilN
MLMIEHRRSLDREFIAVRAEQSQYPWLQSLDLPKLRQERDDLMQRTSSIERYLSSRILWTECHREIAALLPEGMVVTKIDGQATYEVAGGKGRRTTPKRSLTLAIDAPIPAGGAVSPEVETLIESLRESPLLQKTLPDVGMAGLRWGAGGQSRLPTASFVIHCQPGTRSARPSRETSP